MARRSPISRRPLVAIAIGVLVVLALAGVVVGYLGDEHDDHPAAAVDAAGDVTPIPTPVGIREPWNGRAFVNDNVWTEGDAQFAVWVDAAGSPIVGRRRHGDDAWRTADLGRLPGNPLGAPTADDEHNIYVLAVDGAGYVHVAGNMHGSRLRYVRSQDPLDIDEWTAGTMVGFEETSVSYPAFARAPDGALLFFYRDGTAGLGDVVLNRLGPTGGWRRVATLIDGRSSAESAYLQRVAVDPVRGAIHLMFVWRRGGDAAGNRDPSYLRSDDGGTTWRASNGRPLELPVTHRTADVVAPTGSRSPVPVNQGGLAVDDGGRPHAVLRIRGGTGSGAELLHVWWDGRAWRADPVTGLGDVVGRPAVVGGGRGPVLLLWADRLGDGTSALRVATLAGGEVTGVLTLARMAVDEWEPTFDSRAQDERLELSVLFPVRRVATDEPAATAAVGTWSLPALVKQLDS